ncbi:MAG: tetratricopeptide repeat protein [Halanaerobiales bacterium]
MKKFFYIFFLASIIFLLSTFSTLADNSSLFLEGVNQYYQGDYREAVNIFSEFLTEAENDNDALYYQTLAYLELNNISAARSNIQHLNNIGYSYALHHWKLGELYLNKEGVFDSPFYNEAKRELERANQLGISSAALYSDLAMAYSGLGNQEKAAENYEIAVEKGAELDDYLNLANLYKDTGRINAAIKLYNKILEEDAQRSTVYLNLGNLYREQEDYPAAIDVLKKGLDLDNTVAIRRSLAESYYYNENYQEAKRHFEQLIDKNPNIYQAYFYLGEIYNLIEGNYELAINYYQRAVNYNRNYVKAYLALGNLYFETEEYYRAITQYMNAIDSNPNHAEAHYRLALSYHEMGRIDSAIEELRTTLHLDSSHNKARLLLNRLQENQ